VGSAPVVSVLARFLLINQVTFFFLINRKCKAFASFFFKKVGEVDSRIEHFLAC
jgi:hypothetical protein